MPDPDMPVSKWPTLAEERMALKICVRRGFSTREEVAGFLAYSAVCDALVEARLAAEAVCAARVEARVSAREERLATFAGLVERRIRHTCDVTKAGRAGDVRVPTAEWHGIMALMEAARDALTKGAAS